MLFINHVFLCLIRSPIYLYCSPVILCCHFNVIFNIAIKVRGLACHKTRFNPPFFSLKMSCTKSGIWPLLYYSSFLYVLHFNVASFVFSNFLEKIHNAIRRVTVLVYAKFMYMGLKLYIKDIFAKGNTSKSLSCQTLFISLSVK